MSQFGEQGGGIPFPPGASEDSPVFVISVAAQLSGLHAQTLRTYDRLGLVSPGRTAGGGRRYSARDIALLKEVQRLSQEEGVNLAGVKRIIELATEAERLRAEVEELHRQLAAAHAAADHAAAAVHASYRRDLVPLRPQQTALVVWKPPQR
ncbi:MULTISPECIES: heat shock protein transcriptional repressor HspR [unclassified Crossiella]|uniref:heat shock protein transcriptional repressor HspR n=1 Tax=unclassified Crossiella TaxID=2620835 RepID=UPI001FFF2B2A|nr:MULTISPECIES: helix-turn-helix transcriptional regulator [unclassified Crossiella]MCK2236456.1 helix-turn-helix transcriptional regulator [Crossiella sp. S99.2]MCK2250123.1 helix-turn-helix transcriptional regulator [Crossiella sp. S99.1]